MLNNALYIVATPIGNIKDISFRAIETLSEADIIACEDTRVSKKLFSLLNLKTDKPFISYQDYSEEEKSQHLTELLLSGKSIALISDAGSPLISDPGYKLVRKCVEQNIKVYSVPGASAVICALQLSGLPTNRFMFAGFIPNKDKARMDLFIELSKINTTLVFYETAPRLCKTLLCLNQVFPDREIAVAREITKIFEECKRASAQELYNYYNENSPKGEIVIIVSPPCEKKLCDFDLEYELKTRLENMSVKSAVKEVAELTKSNRNDIYNLALRLKNDQ